MKVTVIGAGNSGLAMAAHLSYEGNEVTLWNRSHTTIAKLKETHIIHCVGAIEADVPISKVTNDIEVALEDPELILVTTPASSHRDIAELIAKNINKSTLIVLNPGRTFGALEFNNVYKTFNIKHSQTIAETQTIIYTCRKFDVDKVNIISFKDSVLIASLGYESNKSVIDSLPKCIQPFFIPAESTIETSVGNVGMILHCAPLLLNTGWTETEAHGYNFYYNGITPTVCRYIEKMDMERVAVSEAMGHKVETTQEWLIRSYNVTGDTLYECIQNNKAYETIDAPKCLRHRYIFEDIPCGLVPLEAMGQNLGLDMSYTGLTIDLASKLVDVDFRKTGRNLEWLGISAEDQIV